ncbi:MAG: hypothetical protein J0H50_14810 [Xanthomonadales bacterium]|nr:hypothetical protein [Xanthomonadales bacterium]
MQWQDIGQLAAVISAICAIVAATVSVLIWRKARAGDLSKQISDGDRDVKKHTDRSVAGVNQRLSTMDARMSGVEDGVARIEQQQQHNLTARDLGAVHEKINRLAENLAANTASTQGMREQLGVIHRLLMSKP